MACVDETGNADGNNPNGKRGWQWIMAPGAAIELLESTSGEIAAR